LNRNSERIPRSLLQGNLQLFSSGPSFILAALQAEIYIGGLNFLLEVFSKTSDQIQGLRLASGLRFRFFQVKVLSKAQADRESAVLPRIAG
jgi:hypothetical protein